MRILTNSIGKVKQQMAEKMIEPMKNERANALKEFKLLCKEFALELLCDRPVTGGIVVFDDYNAVAGETISVDEFAAKHKLKLEKLPF